MGAALGEPLWEKYVCGGAKLSYIFSPFFGMYIELLGEGAIIRLSPHPSQSRHCYWGGGAEIKHFEMLTPAVEIRCGIPVKFPLHYLPRDAISHDGIWTFSELI